MHGGITDDEMIFAALSVEMLAPFCCGRKAHETLDITLSNLSLNCAATSTSARSATVRIIIEIESAKPVHVLRCQSKQLAGPLCEGSPAWEEIEFGE